MKFSSEIKIGLIGIVTLAVLIWGINYLKGRNVLSSTYTLYTSFDNAGGLESSSPVIMHGMKIGYVHQIELFPDEPKPIKILLNIEKIYPIHTGSIAVLFSADLLGTKAIRIESSSSPEFMMDNDTIKSLVEADMLSAIQALLEPVIQQVGTLAVSLDTLAVELEQLIGSETTRESLDHLSSISAALSATLNPGGSLHKSFKNLESFTSMLENQEDEFTSLIEHINSISESVDSAGINELTQELQAATHQFNLLLEKINKGEGNAGKFIHEDSLYLNLDLLITDLDELIRDLNENPEDYVHFSLFGNSQKKNP